MRRALLALVLVAVTALGAVVVNMGAASAWKCDRYPEQPTCTTLPPPTVPNTTERTTTTEPPVTYTVPSTTPEPLRSDRAPKPRNRQEQTVIETLVEYGAVNTDMTSDSHSIRMPYDARLDLALALTASMFEVVQA